MSMMEPLVKAVSEGDPDAAALAAGAVVEAGIAPNVAVEAMTQGMRHVGEQFARMEIFLTELMLAAQAMKAAMKVLEPVLRKQAAVGSKKGVVVMATVEGDMHEIGKDIAIKTLEASGFEVHDLGVDVNPLDIVKAAERLNADIIGASALMTTTMPQQRDLIEILRAKGLRDRFHVILGGGPVTREWVDECGADSWGENAAVAARLLEGVMEARD